MPNELESDAGQNAGGVTTPASAGSHERSTLGDSRSGQEPGGERPKPDIPVPWYNLIPMAT